MKIYPRSEPKIGSKLQSCMDTYIIIDSCMMRFMPGWKLNDSLNRECFIEKHLLLSLLRKNEPDNVWKIII